MASSASTNKTYTVSGNGLVIASVSIVSADTTTTGTAQARVYLGNDIYAAESIRKGDSASASLAVTATAAISVSSGNTIRLYTINTASATMTVYYTVTTLGCTVS